MRLNKYWILIPLLSFALGVAVGCSESGGSKKGNTPTQPVPPGPEGDCTADNSCQKNAALSWGDTFHITNHKLYRQFLRDVALVCDPYQWSIWIGYDPYACENLDHYSFLEIHLSSDSLPSQGTAIVWVYSETLYMYNYAIPVSISGEFTPANYNTSFGLMTRGFDYTPSYNANIWIVALDSKPSDNQIRVEIYYDEKFDTQDISNLPQDKKLGYGYLRRY
jgi:hypothetical protein